MTHNKKSARHHVQTRTGVVKPARRVIQGHKPHRRGRRFPDEKETLGKRSSRAQSVVNAIDAYRLSIPCFAYS